MGDAPLVKDHLLIAFMRDLPPALIEQIQAKFPDVEVSVLTLERGVPLPSGWFLNYSSVVSVHLMLIG